ncbi:MAG: type I polyketide synthase [Anaerolineae bacterium]|nr:type I polyketide synthase [Anaerolineae bacterium]
MGAVKTNIGHLEAAAGMAGIIKVLLAMKHKTLPGLTHFNHLNSRIKLADSPFYLVEETKAWPPLPDEQGNDRPRRAGVSSFGFGGTNAHVVLEAYPETEVRRPESGEGPQLMVLSARNEERLRVHAQQILAFVEESPPISLTEMAYTLQVGREAMESRIALVVNDIRALGEKLTAYLAGEATITHCYRGQVKPDQDSPNLQNDDDDSPALIRQWLVKGKLEKLAASWVNGLEIDWSLQYRAEKPRRISLPTYPFAKERYWLPSNGQLTLGNGQFSILNTQFSIEPLHPLVHQNTSTLTEQRFSTVFRGNEFFLNDHQIRGEKILPGVAYLEMARAAGAMAIEHEAITEIKDVVWLKPLVVKDEPVKVHLSLHPVARDTVTYEVRTRDGTGQPVVHGQGKLIFGAIAEADPVIDLAVIRQRCQIKKSGAVCYEQFEQQGLAYGPTFQVIEDVIGNDTEALARLRLPAEADVESYGLPPSLLDGVLQSVIGLTGRDDAPHLGLSVPFAVERLEIVGPIPPTGYAYVTRLAGQSDTTHFNMALLDEAGRVSVKFHNITLKAVPQPNQGWYYRPYWQREALPEEQSTGGETGEAIIIVVPKGMAGLAAGLARRYPQPQVIRLLLSDRTVRVSKTVWEIDLSDETGLEKSLNGLAKIDTVYFLGGLVEPPSATADLPVWVRSQEQGVLSLFRLIKVLEQRGLMAHLARLKVLTGQAQQVLPRKWCSPGAPR